MKARRKAKVGWPPEGTMVLLPVCGWCNRVVGEVYPATLMDKPARVCFRCVEELDRSRLEQDNTTYHFEE